MQVTSANTATEMVSSAVDFSKLPVPLNFSSGCPRSVRIEIDILLLALEALDNQAIDYLISCIPKLELESVIPNRVVFWRLRNTNPLRRNYQRGNLEWDQARALVRLVSFFTTQATTGLRLLLMTEQYRADDRIDKLGLRDEEAFLMNYINQFVVLYKNRMGATALRHDTDIVGLAQQLLQRLLLSSGKLGEVRLWHSLFDGVKVN
ncbi:MAG: DUF3038 domain-containing protein [Pseudanabaena sp. ELA607]|jgi:hypothetical protein